MVEHNRIKESVFEIIKRYATEEKPLDQKEISRFLQEDSRNECDRKTVSRALEKLREEYGLDENGDWENELIRLHYEVTARSSSPIYKKYWLEIYDDGEFTDEELLFLMDAVQFSKHVDQKFAEEIAKKLTYLSGNKNSRLFELHTKVNEKDMPARKEFLMILGDINVAIEQRKMISFYVNEYGTDKKLHRVGKPVEVCPYRIVVADGNYYLLCGERMASTIKSFRVDRISDVKVTGEEYTFSIAEKKAVMYPNDYIVEHRYMNNGEPVNVTLTIDRSILGDVIDSFGTKVKIDPAADSSNRLTVHLKSGERDIVDWAMRYGQFAVIVEPEYLRTEVKALASIISCTYRDRNQDIFYLEHIERAGVTGNLWLSNIDLNGKNSYRELSGIRSLRMNHNGIKDFSFLSSYTELERLQISHNEISDPGVLAGLNSLRSLDLEMTGITDLEFLTGLENLTRISLREHCLENVEAVYSVPNLMMLIVNKPVSRLIDKKKLKKAYGDSLQYIVADGKGLSMQSLPPAENTDLKLNEELMKGYATIEVTDPAIREKICSQIYSGSDAPRGTDKEFCLIDGACDGAERLRMYEDPGHYVNAKYAWYVTCDAASAKKAKLDLNKVCAISVFKQDHGLKLIGLAMRNHRLPRNSQFDDSLEQFFIGVGSHIRYILDNEIGWAELNGPVEREFRSNSSINDVINPAVLVNRKVFKDIEIDDDDYHYNRKDESGKSVKRIAYGHLC